MIIQAQENGQDMPDVNIKFPPGYLEVCVSSHPSNLSINCKVNEP
jgi:hypothetical protein